MNKPVLNSMPRISGLYISPLYTVVEDSMASRSLCMKLGGYCFLSLLLTDPFGVAGLGATSPSKRIFPKYREKAVIHFSLSSVPHCVGL